MMETLVVWSSRSPLEKRNGNESGVARLESKFADEFIGQFTDVFTRYEDNQALFRKRYSSVVSALASGGRGTGFDARCMRGKVLCPNTHPFVSFKGTP